MHFIIEWIIFGRLWFNKRLNERSNKRRFSYALPLMETDLHFADDQKQNDNIFWFVTLLSLFNAFIPFNIKLVSIFLLFILHSIILLPIIRHPIILHSILLPIILQIIVHLIIIPILLPIILHSIKCLLNAFFTNSCFKCLLARVRWKQALGDKFVIWKQSWVQSICSMSLQNMLKFRGNSTKHLTN